MQHRWASRVVGDSLCLWVFHRRGKPVKNFYRVWRSACNKVRNAWQAVNDFRRTAARDIVDAGYDAFTAADHGARDTIDVPAVQDR